MNDNFNNPNGLNESNSLSNNELNNLNNVNFLSNEEFLGNDVVVEQSSNINSGMGVNTAASVEPLTLNANELNVTNSPEPLTSNIEVVQSNFNPVTPEVNAYNGFSTAGSDVLNTNPSSNTIVENHGSIDSENGNNEKKNKSLIAIIVVLILALGAAAGLFVYKYIIMSNPASIIEKALTTLGKDTNKAIVEYNSELKTVLNSKIQNELTVSLNDNKADLLLKMDMKNKVISAKADVVVQNEDFLNVEGIINEDTVYLKLLKDTTNIFKTNGEFAEIFEIAEEIEDIDPILSNFITYLGESVKENLTKEDFEKTKEEISYKGKQVNATRYALDFNAQNINPILDTYKNKLINDDKLVSYIAKLSEENGFDKSEVKEELTNIIDNMKLDDPEKALEKAKLLIYVKGRELVKISFDDPDGRLDLEVYDGLNLVIKPKEDKGILSLTCKEEEFSFKFTDNNETDIIAEFANGKYKVKIKSDEDVNLTGTYKINDNNIELTFIAEIKGEKYSGKIISKETISDTFKIDIPKNALDVEDEANQMTLMEEMQAMPVYVLLEMLMGTKNEDHYDDYYNDYDNNYDYYYDNEIDNSNKWEF